MDPEPGEEVFFHGHPSWLWIIGFYLKGLLVTVLAGALAGVISAIASGSVEVGWVIAVVLVGFVIVLVAGQVQRLRTTYTITNQRLRIKTGLLSRDQHETRLERVQNVNSSQSVLERMVGIGTVDFDTAAEAEFDFSFRGVADPHEIVRTVDRALRSLPAEREPDADAGV